MERVLYKLRFVPTVPLNDEHGEGLNPLHNNQRKEKMVSPDPSVEAAEALKTWEVTWKTALQIAENLSEASEEVFRAWEQIRLPLGVAKEAAEAAIKAAMENALYVGWESSYWCRNGNEEKAWEEARGELGLYKP